MKRIVSLILTLAMVLSLMAGMAIGVGAEAAPVVLNEMNIYGTLPTLKAGDALPAVSFTTAEGADYSVTAVWQGDGSNDVPAGTEAKSGQVYSLYVEINAKEGYGFTWGGDYYLNDDYANFYLYNYIGEDAQGNDIYSQLYTSFDYPLLTPVDRVDVGYNLPVLGEKLDFEAIVPENANYTAEVNWYDYATEDGWVSEGTVVTTGGRYEPNLSIYSAEGYMFTADTQVYLNGEKWDDPNWSYDRIDICADIYDFKTEVTQLSVTYTEPKVGQALSAPQVNSDQYKIADAYWYDETNDDAVEPGTLVEAGHKYSISIEFAAADGYKFSWDTVLTVNGKAADPDEDYAVEYDMLYYYREYSFTEKISAVTVTMADPVVGQPFPQPVIPSDAKYSMTATWYDGYTDETVTGNVQDGDIYYMEVEVSAPFGYEFAWDATVTLNGQKESWNDYDGYTTMIFYGVYSFAKPLEKIEIFYDVPKVGQVPGAITIPQGANYSLDEEETGWFYYDTFDKIPGNIEEGYRYEPHARVELKRGYELAIGVTEIYINGEGYIYSGGGSDWLNTGVTITGESITTAKPVDKVALPAWPELKVGDKLPQISGEADTYEYYCLWTAMEADGDRVYADSAKENYLYYLELIVSPKSGYEFTEDTVVTVGGASLSDWGYVDYTSAMDVKVYNFGAVQELDTVNLITSIPGAGQAGGTISAPAGAGYILEEALWMVASDETFEDVKVQEGAYKTGDRVGLVVMANVKPGYIFKPGMKLTVNGKEYPVVTFFGYIEYAYVILDLGEVKKGAEYNGLVEVDGVWGYYEGGVLQTHYTGLVPYGDKIFYVEEGILTFTYTGLVYYMDEWRYVANSELTDGYTGLVYFNDNWFYTVNSRIDWTFTGLVAYQGNTFYVQNNLLDWSYTGLGYHNGEWYFIQNGLLQLAYTGLVYFNETWFYVEDGHLTFDYIGLVEYEGNRFYVQNNVLDWGYTGLGYHDGGWYYIENALLKADYNGLVYFNDTWFYIENGELTWATNGLRMHNGDLFLIVGSVVDWTYTGPATYNGTEYDVVNGFVDL